MPRVPSVIHPTTSRRCASHPSIDLCSNPILILVISHDMDFIAAVADRILVLEGGRIVADGDHATLVVQDGLYRRLYEAQNASAP